ncbi:MAG: SH3 domain-containing protein [Anaerolineae bacterium]|nr:SH3 domain-containing protein [Anaerolineae bacterium]
MRARQWLFLCFLLVLGFTPQVVLGQSPTTDETCPALVKKALEDVGNNCDALDRNSACYGFNRVDAAFFEAQEEGFFSTPSDRTGLNLVQSIETAPLSSALDLWGIATLNVQANVPGSLPGQAVVFMLMGDVEIENAVEPAEAYTPADPIDVTVLAAANMRSGPGTNWNIVGSVPRGEVVPVDGLNAGQDWVRVLYNDILGWMSRDLVQPEVQGSLSDLPVIDETKRTPMQAFYFRTGVGGLECVESPPSVLVVQGPNNVRVDITANGADITIGSTIALTLTEDNKMQLFVLSGSATVDGVVIPAGFMTQIQLSEDGRSPIGPWEGNRPMTAEEINQFLPLQNIPVNLLHYEISLPTLQQIAQILAAIQAGSGGGSRTIIIGKLVDEDGDGIPDSTDDGRTLIDQDGDGIPDITEDGQKLIDTDDDGIPDGIDDTPPGEEATEEPGIGPIVLIPGQYETGGGCQISGGAPVTDVAADGSGFTWGRVRFNRAGDGVYYAGSILAVVIAPDRFRVGGLNSDACVADWVRVGP